jgi:orotate phosphoribosyltransferase
VSLKNASYISWRYLHRSIPLFCNKLPADTVGLIGIPRSGMMTATLMGQHMNLPVGDVDSFVRTGALWTVGRRFHDQEEWPTTGTYVLVDDSMNTGQSMEEAKELVSESLTGGIHLRTAAMYVLPGNKDKVDYHHQVLPLPRAFAWNWHSKRASQHWMVDIDVLRNPDGELLLRPKFPIGWLLAHCNFTAEPLAQWLQDNGIVTLRGQCFFGEDASSDGAALVYKATPDAHLLVCANKERAIEIAAIAGKPVLSTDSDELIHPPRVSS